MISMMLTCDASVVVDYNRIRAGLCNTPLDVEYDKNSIEQCPSKHGLLNITYIRVDLPVSRSYRRKVCFVAESGCVCVCVCAYVGWG